LNARSAVTPIALIVVAAATVAYAFFVDRAKVSDSERTSRKRDVFPSFRVEEVRRVELSHGSEVLVLERDQDAAAGWSMTSPRREHADPAAVDALTRDLETAIRVRDVPPDEALGLDSPRVRGKVSLGALEYRFVVGGDAPRPSGAAYMRVDGEGTFVVTHSLAMQLLRSAEAYRDRAVVRYGAGEVSRVELRTSTGALVLERAAATFRVADASGLRASRAAVDHLFTALAEMRAETFVDDATADLATAKPSLDVVIVPREAGRPRARLLIGGDCAGQTDRVVVVREEPERMSACVARSAALGLGEPPGGFVDGSPIFARPDEIAELRLEPVSGNGPRVDLARRGSGWHERAPDDRDLDGDEVDDANALVAALSSARALEVRRPEAGPPGPARWRATVVRSGSGTTEVVELVAAASDGSALARRLDDDAILHLPAPAARRFEPHPVALRSRAIWEPAFDAAEVVAVDDSCGHAHRRIEMRDGSWTSRMPAGGVDAAASGDLLGSFAHARADSWVTEIDDGSFGLSGPGACTLVFTIARSDAAASRAGIVLGSKGEGGVYARVVDGAAVMVAPLALREVAEKLSPWVEAP